MYSLVGGGLNRKMYSLTRDGRKTNKVTKNKRKMNKLRVENTYFPTLLNAKIIIIIKPNMDE